MLLYNATAQSPSRSLLRYSLPPSQQSYQIVPINRQPVQRRQIVNNQFSDSLPQLYDYNSVLQLRTFGKNAGTNLNQSNTSTMEARRSPYYYNDLATMRIDDVPDSNKNLKYFPKNCYEPNQSSRISSSGYEHEDYRY